MESFARLRANGTALATAYQQAGYKSKTPDSHGARLARSGQVAARIAYLVAQRSLVALAASTVDAARIQQELEFVAFSDVGEVFEAVPEPTDGESPSGTSVIVNRMKPVSRWPRSLRAAVAKIKAKRYIEGSGDAAREVETIEVAFWPKIAAIHELRDHMGLIEPEEINVNVRGVVALPVMQVPRPGAGDTIIDVDADVTPDLNPPTKLKPLNGSRDDLLALLRGPG